MFDIEVSAWTREEALKLATEVEAIAPQFGAHVGLTGGLLYKEGPRKDADLLFSRIRQEALNLAGLLVALEGVGLVVFADHGFVKKASYNGKVVDLLFPEQCQSSPDAPAPEGRYS
jgi:hypothetical protein